MQSFQQKVSLWRMPRRFLKRFKAGFPLDGIIRTERLLFWSRGTQSEQYDWFAEFSAAEKLNLIQLDPTFQCMLLAEFDEKQ